MAAIIVNSADTIQFVNASGGDIKNDPTLIIQAGDWDVGNSVETGVTFDVFGEQTPILTPANVRKLAQWLSKTADILDKYSETLVDAYAAKMDATRDEILAMVAAETWFTAKEALAIGLVDGIADVPDAPKAMEIGRAHV